MRLLRPELAQPGLGLDKAVCGYCMPSGQGHKQEKQEGCAGVLLVLAKHCVPSPPPCHVGHVV